VLVRRHAAWFSASAGASCRARRTLRTCSRRLS
jgi:hypothetical protein